MVITADALREQLGLYLGWGYSPGDPRYPCALPGVRLPQSPPRQTNCCAFVEGLAVGAAVRSGADPGWSLARHKRAMIYDPADRAGPVEVLTAAGLADPVAVDRPPPVWSICQGWRGPRGHTFAIGDVEGDAVAIIEANRGYGLDGVGWRGHGVATDVAPPMLWHRDPRAWTWAGVLAVYPEIYACALRVG